MEKIINGLSRWLGQRQTLGVLRKALRLGCMLTLLLGLGVSGTVQAAIPASERAVLVNLYNSTNGAKWTNNSGWNGAAGTECSWIGVTCDSAQDITNSWLWNLLGCSLVGGTCNSAQSHVTGIFLNGNRLSGTLPSLSGLMALQGFGVDNNQLTGSVPAAPSTLLAGQSRLCNNQLQSSGNTAIDAAWTTATGANWLSCQRQYSSPTAPPVCTLTSYDGGATFTPKDEVLLTANCTPAATTFVWTGGSCAGKTTATCSDYPQAATTYSVVASNAQGSDSKRELTMTPSAASSVCSLTADKNPVVVGESYTLTGACGTSNVISAQWTGEGCTAATGSRCTVTSTKAGAFTYSVTFTLMTGVKYTAATTVTVIAVPTPACTLTASPTTVAAGASSTLTASCAPAATSYTWSDASCLATSATCTVKPTAETTYTVKGKNAAGEEGSPATATVKVNSASGSYQGMWWNPSESGWGISLTQHSDKIFAALYTYDDAQQPTWYVISDCPIRAEKPGSCTGDIYKVTGGSAPLVAPWKKPSDIAAVGSGTFTFTDTATGKFAYTLNGTPGENAIEKFAFAGSTPPFAVDYTNLWMTAGEDGWGVALTQDKGNIFAAWYTYNIDGRPAWYTAQCALTGTSTGSSRCDGDLLYVTGGAPLTSPWSINRQLQEQGSVRFSFTSNTQGEMVFIPKTGSSLLRKTITPFDF